MGSIRLTWAVLLAGILVAPTLAAAPAPALALDAVCLPQLAACVPPADACASLAPPGGVVSLRVHADAPLARLHATPGGKDAWTNAAGDARIAFAGAAGHDLLRVALDDGAAVSHAIRRAALAVRLTDAPTVADALDPPTLRLRVVGADDGSPIEGAMVLVRVGNATLDAGPTDAAGHAALGLRPSGEARETVAVLDAQRCGLPVAELPPPYALDWRIPDLEPLPTLTLHAPAAWARGPHELAYSAVGPRAPHQLEWRPVGAAAWRDAPILLDEGAHEVEARVQDAAGRWSAPARASVRVDATPPALSLPAGWSACAPYAATAADALSGVAWARLFVDGVERTGAVALPEGPHEVRFEAMDHAGNLASAAGRVACDAAAPEVAPVGDLAAWSGCTAAAWVVRDAGSGLAGLTATVDGRPAGVLRDGGTARVPLPEGRVVATLRATDAAGNVAASSVTAQCDRSPPTLALAPDGRTVRAVAGDAHSGLREVRMRVDDGAWTLGDAVTLQGEGARVVHAEATDALGHAATASLTVPVDTLAPRIDAPARATAGGAFDLTVVDAALAAVEMGVGDAWTPLPQADGGRFTASLAGIEPGRVVVRARDAAGNVAAVDVEVAAPPARVHVPPADPPADPAPTQTPPPPPQEERAAVAKLESVVVSVMDAPAGSEVRLTGLAQGIDAGEAFLVDADGERTALGAVRVQDGVLKLDAASPLTGTYGLELRLRTATGGTLVHEAGNVTLAGPEATLDAAAVGKPAPGMGLVALLGTLALAAVGLRRR